MADHSLQVRQAIIAKLVGDEPLRALVDDRIYGMAIQSETAYPHIRYGVSFTKPNDTACYQGSDIDVTLHVFSQALDEGECAQICARISHILHDQDLGFEGGEGLQSLDWSSTKILTEDSEFHGLVLFDVLTR